MESSWNLVWIWTKPPPSRVVTAEMTWNFHENPRHIFYRECIDFFICTYTNLHFSKYFNVLQCMDDREEKEEKVVHFSFSPLKIIEIAHGQK